MSNDNLRGSACWEPGGGTVLHQTSKNTSEIYLPALKSCKVTAECEYVDIFTQQENEGLRRYLLGFLVFYTLLFPSPQQVFPSLRSCSNGQYASTIAVACCFSVSRDFVGSNMLSDLRLYHIEVDLVWRPATRHVSTMMECGRCIAVEVFHLDSGLSATAIFMPSFYNHHLVLVIADCARQL